jgi:ABC-type bacteriocin/lantibiotic exporter with double-glycine peptidase domain
MSSSAASFNRDRALVEDVVGRVETILDPASGGSFAASEPPLSAAIRAVAKHYGRKPEGGQQRAPGESTEDAIERMARSAQMISREIPVEAGWQRRYALPFIAERAEDGTPFALIPSGSSWLYVDGSRPRKPVKLDAETAASLGRVGWAMSPSLPDKKLTLKDLLLFGLGTKLPDLVAFTALTFLAGLVLAVLPLANIAVMDIVIPGGDFTMLRHVAVMLIALIFATLITRFAASLSQLRIDGRTGLMLRTAAADRMIRVSRGMGGDKAPPPAAAALITRSVESWHKGVWKLVLSVAGALLVALPSLGVMMHAAPVAGLVCLAAMLLAVGLSAWIAQRQVASLFSGACSPTSWISLSYEALSQVETVRATGAESRFFKLFAESFLALKERFLSSDRMGSSIHALEAALEALILTLGIAAAILLQKSLPAQDGVAFTTALMTVTGAAVALVHAFLQASMLGLQRRMIQPVLDAVPAPYGGGSRLDRIAGDIEVCDIVVRRSAGARAILQNVSLRIGRGEHIGIVGASGSGKSTLLRALLGLEKLESGSIKFDGVDLALLDAAAIRRQIGVVGQSGRLFPGTLFENISAGLKLSEAQVMHAVRLAALEADIRALPLGLSTPIGDAEPILSMGQIQRVLLARALAHRPSLVVLDEATSALDPAAEAHVAASIDALNATVITVAHRLDTVRRCDRIYVLKDGMIVEAGTFDELAASQGILTEFLSADARSRGEETDPVGSSIRKIQREFNLTHRQG